MRSSRWIRFVLLFCLIGVTAAAEPRDASEHRRLCRRDLARLTVGLLILNAVGLRIYEHFDLAALPELQKRSVWLKYDPKASPEGRVWALRIAMENRREISASDRGLLRWISDHDAHPAIRDLAKAMFDKPQPSHWTLARMFPYVEKVLGGKGFPGFDISKPGAPGNVAALEKAFAAGPLSEEQNARLRFAVFRVDGLGDPIDPIRLAGHPLQEPRELRVAAAMLVAPELLSLAPPQPLDGWIAKAIENIGPEHALQADKLLVAGRFNSLEAAKAFRRMGPPALATYILGGERDYFPSPSPITLKPWRSSYYSKDYGQHYHAGAELENLARDPQSYRPFVEEWKTRLQSGDPASIGYWLLLDALPVTKENAPLLPLFEKLQTHPHHSIRSVAAGQIRAITGGSVTNISP